MKIKCEKCGQDLSKNIRESFEQYEIGRTVCPKCHTKQKRYISESELLMYFGVQALFYVVIFTIIMAILKYIGIIPISFILIAAIFVIGYFILKNVSLLIYEKAYFKQELKNVVFVEDKTSIQKHLRWQFIMFMLVALMFGTMDEYSFYFIVAIVAFVIIVAIKVYLSIKNEKIGLKKRANDHKEK